MHPNFSNLAPTKDQGGKNLKFIKYFLTLTDTYEYNMNQEFKLNDKLITMLYFNYIII